MLSCIALTGCMTPTNNGSLRSCVERFYRAEAAADAKTVWSMASPVLKSELRWHEFEKQFRGTQEKGRLQSWRILAIEESSEKDASGNPTTNATVSMELTVQYQGEQTPQVEIEKAWDWWTWADGKWFWHKAGMMFVNSID